MVTAVAAEAAVDTTVAAAAAAAAAAVDTAVAAGAATDTTVAAGTAVDTTVAVEDTREVDQAEVGEVALPVSVVRRPLAINGSFPI